MEPKEDNVSTKTLSDATNNNNIVDPAIQVLDPKERKRQRDKARYAALSEEQKSERRKKQQEAYRRPEAMEKRREARNKKQIESDRKDNVDPNDQPAGISANENRVDTLRDMSEDWLHTYDAYTTGLMPPIAPGITSETCVQREPIIDLTENNNTADSEVHHANQDLDPKERKRLRDREWYAALSEEQKADRRKTRKKQREAYHRPEAVEKRREARNKKQRKTCQQESVESVDTTDQPAVSSVNENHDETEDWLHTNDAYTPRLIQTKSTGSLQFGRLTLLKSSCDILMLLLIYQWCACIKSDASKICTN